MTDRALALFELIRLQAEAEAMAGGVGHVGQLNAKPRGYERGKTGGRVLINRDW